MTSGKLDKLGTAVNTPTRNEELAHLTKKLEKLVLTLHPCPTHTPVDESIHVTMQQYIDTLCAIQWQTNLKTSPLQDITMFCSQDTSKLEYWLSDIETAADILREINVCLAEAKS